MCSIFFRHHTEMALWISVGINTKLYFRISNINSKYHELDYLFFII